MKTEPTLKQMKSRTQRFIKTTILSLGFCAYIALGAFCFVAIEGEENKILVLKTRQEILRAMQNFTEEHRDCGVTRDAVAGILERVNAAREQGAFRADADPSNGINPTWNLVDTMTFALTVITTIGYGDMVPRTEGGQFFCMIYALVGVPLCCLVLVVVGETFQAVSLGVFRCFASLKPKILRWALYLIMPTMSIWIYMTVIPTLTVMQTQDWPYVRAQYYTFISLSTIGFGDDLPHRDSPYTVYAYAMKIIFAVYILISLSLNSITFTGVLRAIKYQRMKRKRRGSELSQISATDVELQHCDELSTAREMPVFN